MKYMLRFLPEVEDDAVAAYEWYESKLVGLGKDFLQTLYSTTEETTLNPLLYQLMHGEIRRRLLRRFPYAVYFTLDGNELVVLGVFHCARDPRSTFEELRRRG